MRTEDGYLIYQCLNGKPAAFGLLVDKYKEAIYALVYTELGDFHDAQDVTQETFLQAYRKLPTLRRWDSFLAWLYSIARNQCRNWARNQKRRIDMQELDPRAVGASSMDTYESLQNRQYVHDALQTLPQTHRQVVSLHYFAGLSGAQIAEILRISPNAVHQRLRRARGRLRQELLDTMCTVADETKLQPGFTFHILEMVKRSKPWFRPNTLPLPLGVSVLVGLWLTLAIPSSWYMPFDTVGKMVGSAVAGSVASVAEAEIPVAESEEMQITFLSGFLEKGMFGDERQPSERFATERNWTRLLGGTGNERAGAIQQTQDGGYIVTGYTESPPLKPGDRDVYLVKLDAQGIIEWTSHYGGAVYDEGTSVQQTRDGGYIVAGGSTSFRDGDFDVYLAKVDPHGELEWEQTYGGTDEDCAYSVQQTSDDGYIVAGNTESGASHVRQGDIYLLKVDARGKLEWEQTYGGITPDSIACIQLTRDGGYILVGGTFSGGMRHKDVYLVKLDASGDVEWDYTCGGTNADWGHSVQQTLDRGYIVSGATLSFGNGDDADLYLAKISVVDASPVLEWERHYRAAKDTDNAGFSVQQIEDGGYMVAGWTAPTNNIDESDVYLIKVDADGTLQWDKTFGTVGNKDMGRSLCRASDGGYVIAGDTTSVSDGQSDICLIRISDFPDTQISDDVYSSAAPVE